MTVHIPSLKHCEGSWVCVRKSDDKPVCEFMKDSKLVEKLNFDKYRLVPIGAYLANLNRR